MKLEQYNFDDHLNFFTNVKDYSNILQVIPSCFTVNDKPGIRFSAYGLTAPNFENLTVTITQGSGIISSSLDEEFDCLDFYFAPHSDEGIISISDTNDTYLFSWKKIEETLFQFTNYNDNSVFYDSKTDTISPASVTEYQEKLIEEYHNLDTNPLLKLITGDDPEALFSLKSFLFKKMKKAQALKN